jgi:predicted transcriptional regulator
MNKQVLESLINNGLSQREIAKKLNCSQGAIKYQLSKHILKTKKSQYNRLREPDSVICDCGETDKSKFYFRLVKRKKYYRFRCKACDNKSNIERFRTYKKLAVAYKGGKCEKCGYATCLGALDFHHKNPILKDPNWINIRSWTPHKIKKELDKCMLLCANCHRELHWNLGD